jgi:hypothetical protein
MPEIPTNTVTYPRRTSVMVSRQQIDKLISDLIPVLHLPNTERPTVSDVFEAGLICLGKQHNLTIED